ncbi:UNVERIFIED_CONTAM: hypothetical protein GTU68_011775 [Idotea baltica]|nr:hypothetical protein [Idotea baltica]
MQSRPVANIHLSNIVENWKALCARAPSGKTAAVVKANAYGHGARQVGEALHDAGCDIFFVAYAFEGEQLRRALGPHALIYVLNGPSPDQAVLYQSAALSAVVNSPKQFQTLYAWLQSGIKIPYALHFDTGMNRLGLRAEDAAKLATATQARPPELIMSHLACGDETSSPMNAAQPAKLSAIAAVFPGIPVSLANSGGVMLGGGFIDALPRPGIALYGGGAPADGLKLKPGLTLTAPILTLHIAKKGETVGYGATHTFNTDVPLATVGLGYADGILRSGANQLIGYIDETPCPVVGRISMDLITIDVSKAQNTAKAGTGVEFIGKTATLEAQAARCGTIGYELLTGLSERVERIYQS